MSQADNLLQGIYLALLLLHLFLLLLNLLYAGIQARVLLLQSGALKERQAEPSPALLQAHKDVSQLIVNWDDALADRIAAENLFLDRTKERRRAEIERLHASVGACRADARPFDGLENALRGFWTMECEKGKLRVAITLAPTMPPRVQLLEMRELKGTESPDDRCGA